VKHKKVVQSSRSNIYVLMVIKILCSLKTLTAWAITTVMMSVIVVMIFGNFMTSTHFVLHCRFVECMYISAKD
jgi:hypothetical protein